jgi:hypothetical protein
MIRLRAGAALALALSPVAAQTLIWPGEKLATIDAEHLRAYVPFAPRERLKELVARADHVYAHMMRDAGFTPTAKLRVLVGDWFDAHNGYSFVVPFPLVQVELAPSEPESTIFAGHDETLRTLVHEFAHQISNDRSPGYRGVLEAIFGRVLPNDLLSFLLWYLSTPPHQTMPRFWHEGLGIWAETAYADATSAWAGRGRDPLVHMVWRLDAAAGRIPEVADWRVTYHEWPFGNRAYTYGAAYTRFLESWLGDRASVWRFVATQAQQWPFVFDRGPRRLVGESHLGLIARARRELAKEQEAALQTLRGAKVTELQRLTPADMVAGAPAWLADGSLAFGAKPAHGRARLYMLAANGELDGSSTATLALGSVRALDDGGLVFHEYNWRGIARVELDGATLGWRLLQPDAGPAADGGRTLVAIQLRDGGGQDLVVHRARDGDLDEGAVVPTAGTPWTPALRKGAGHERELAWVETDHGGSRLVLGSLDDRARRDVLLAVRGRILHPAWTSDGAHLFCCADHTGVANAYRVTPPAAPGAEAQVVAVTNTIGGVIACVPSPDGATLALVDHDARGPFVARLPADPAHWAESVPNLALPWPAPIAPREGRTPTGDAQRPTPIPPLPAGAAAALQARAYNGFAELRPLFWAPSTFAVPEGGYGVYGMLADPIFTHVIQAGAGVGLAEQEPVGHLSWDYLGWPIELGLAGGRSERSYSDVVVSSTGAEFDYTETVTRGAFRFGRGLFALERTLLLHATLGIEDHDEVDDAAELYQGQTLVSTPPFTGTEHFAEVTVGYDDSTFYPTSYAAEDGFGIVGVYRHSGFDGDLERNTAFGDASYTWSHLPEAGHQIVVRGQLGWSDGDRTLQGNFSVGGGLSRGLPRGYFDSAVATGQYLAAGSLAYRFPVLREFVASTTTPFRGRQLVVELFGDTAKVSDDRIGGDGDWFTSVGTELHVNFEFFDAVLSPGIGVAVQLDGERDVQAYLSLGFLF